jgi:AcrR family transcriptional regulator
MEGFVQYAKNPKAGPRATHRQLHPRRGRVHSRQARPGWIHDQPGYQYFPNKAAILESLRARHRAKPEQRDAAARRERLAKLPLVEILRALVDGALAERSDNPGMHRTLLTSLPRSERDASSSDRPAQLAAMFGTKIRSATVPGMNLFIARHALLGVIDEAVCTRPAWLSNPAFADELTRLLSTYLEPRSTKRRSR